MTPPNIGFHVDDNHARSTEAAPAPNGLIPYPEWPEVIDSLLDAFVRPPAAGRPLPGASGPSAPADSRPPDSAAVMDKEDLDSVAGGERPGVPRVDPGFKGLLEAVMVLHVRAVLRHNRQVSLNGLKQGSGGGHD